MGAAGPAARGEEGEYSAYLTDEQRSRRAGSARFGDSSGYAGAEAAGTGSTTAHGGSGGSSETPAVQFTMYEGGFGLSVEFGAEESTTGFRSRRRRGRPGRRQETLSRAVPMRGCGAIMRAPGFDRAADRAAPVRAAPARRDVALQDAPGALASPPRGSGGPRGRGFASPLRRRGGRGLPSVRDPGAWLSSRPL